MSRVLSLCTKLLLATVAVATCAGDHTVRAAEPIALTEGALTYQVTHQLKTFGATLEAEDCELLLTVDGSSLETLRFTAKIPLMAFDGGNRLRNEHAGEALETYLFPEALWTVETTVVSHRDPLQGPPRSAILVAQGPLTLHGVTEDLTVEVAATFDSGAVALHATFPISLQSYGIKAPGFMGLRIDDTVTVSVELAAPWPADDQTNNTSHQATGSSG